MSTKKILWQQLPTEVHLSIIQCIPLDDDTPLNVCLVSKTWKNYFFYSRINVQIAQGDDETVTQLLAKLPRVKSLTLRRKCLLTSNSLIQATNCPTLQTLLVSNIQIGDDGAIKIAQCMHDNGHIESLSLINADIDVKGGRALAEMLQKNKTLKFLNLQYNKIGNEGAKLFSQVLENNTTIRGLVLESNRINAVGSLKIATALLNNTTLLNMDIGLNGVGNEAIKQFSKVLANKNCSLTSLNVRYDQLASDSNFPKIDVIGLKSLCDSLLSNTSLTRLDLHGHRIGVDCGTHIARVLQSNSTLLNLDISYNVIKDDGIQQISQVFVANPHLVSLNLRHSMISNDPGSSIISNIITYATNLQSLDLGFNKIGDKGALLLADALSLTKSLKSLCLLSNRLGDEAAKALAKPLRDNHHLHFIDLSYNKIGTVGQKLLKESQEKNPSLLLDITGNKTD